MSTRYDTCPTCNSQTSTMVCNNCKQDFGQNVAPAVSGRVWNPQIQGYVAVDLCETCTALDVNLLDIILADTPTPSDPGEGGSGEIPIGETTSSSETITGQ
ncbi:hypothetical protein ADL27_52085 [Streptomyces sp. NRRL F-6602]|nr:hypothetical protein ADL27_52085 [Streptomyces sp. NRRL F-6602]